VGLLEFEVTSALLLLLLHDLLLHDLLSPIYPTESAPVSLRVPPVVLPIYPTDSAPVSLRVPPVVTPIYLTDSAPDSLQSAPSRLRLTFGPRFYNSGNYSTNQA